MLNKFLILRKTEQGNIKR